MSHIRNTKNSKEIRELVCEAGKGSQTAMSELLEMYTPLIESMTSRFCSDTMSVQDREDLRQEAVSVFLRAVAGYDGEKYDIEFGLYAKICISNGLSSAVRSVSHRSEKTVFPIDEMGERSAVHDDLLERVIEQERFRILSDSINSNLSGFERKVWWLYVSGASAKSIAEKLGKDEKSVSNAVYRIRRKLRSLLS